MGLWIICVVITNRLSTVSYQNISSYTNYIYVIIYVINFIEVQKSSAKKCLQILSQFDLENNICGDKFTVLSNPNNIIKKSDLCK